MRKWTVEEETILINNVADMMASEILKLLPNKTLQQLRNKMYKNGIKISQETYSRVRRVYNFMCTHETNTKRDASGIDLSVSS